MAPSVDELIQIVPSPTKAALRSGNLLGYRVSDPRIMGYLRNNMREYGILIALVVIMAFFQFATGGILLKPVNLTNLILQNSYIVIMALGMLLVIVADGELAALPFAALRDRERQRYLVEDHPVRFASSLRDPTAAARPGQGLSVTLMADPAFDRRGFPELQRLPGAAAEVAAIERVYGGARKLGGGDASPRAIVAALRRGGVAHFAGHAVFDDARPEQSYLVAAPGPGETSARITAAEIEQMDLRQLRLVVLSACQTARAQAGRSGGFAGLAGAFLAAGAGGVVGSLWRVDDESTRVLMERFHAAFAETGDAAGALRQAQLQMIRSTDPALRSPAAWAGFRYTGAQHP